MMDFLEVTVSPSVQYTVKTINVSTKMVTVLIVRQATLDINV